MTPGLFALAVVTGLAIVGFIVMWMCIDDEYDYPPPWRE